MHSEDYPLRALDLLVRLAKLYPARDCEGMPSPSRPHRYLRFDHCVQWLEPSSNNHTYPFGVEKSEFSRLILLLPGPIYFSSDIGR